MVVFQTKMASDLVGIPMYEIIPSLLALYVVIATKVLVSFLEDRFST